MTGPSRPSSGDRWWEQPSSGGTAPVPSSTPAPGPEQAVVTIGDIAVTPHWVVTPNGSRPAGQVQWTALDRTRVEESIPAYAIVLAIVFAVFCLIGLLFLLVKESRFVGHVEVAVHGPGLYHVVQLPVWSAQDVAAVHQMVSTARAVSARAAGW